MPFGIRPSNVRVCHSTTRAIERVKRAKFAAEPEAWQVLCGNQMDNDQWLKIDLHIHTLDDPKDALDYSAHQLLERAKELGFGALAITLHDAVFDRAEVFADAAEMGILLIPAAEVRLQGADIILLNVNAQEVAALKS